MPLCFWCDVCRLVCGGQVVAMVRSSQVCVVSGETGCGKTTQVGWCCGFWRRGGGVGADGRGGWRERRGRSLEGCRCRQQNLKRRGVGHFHLLHPLHHTIITCIACITRVTLITPKTQPPTTSAAQLTLIRSPSSFWTMPLTLAAVGSPTLCAPSHGKGGAATTQSQPGWDAEGSG